MPNTTKIGMFNIPNFTGGVSRGLSSAGLGGSSGALLPSLSPALPTSGGGTPQGREIGAPGAGLQGVVGLNDPCTQSLLATGQPTPCPPGMQHDPPGSCGPCIGIPFVVDNPAGVGLTSDEPTGETPLNPCPDPTSPNPGNKPGEYKWNTATCSWELALSVGPPDRSTKGPIKQTELSDIMSGQQVYGRQKGAQSRQELGNMFGKMGGGIGGGSQGGLEIFQNPLLASGSPYIGKNVSQFDQGGKVKNPYTYSNGGNVDFMTNFKKGLNSAVAAGQIQNVIKNNRSSRRFTSGGKF